MIDETGHLESSESSQGGNNILPTSLVLARFFSFSCSPILRLSALLLASLCGEVLSPAAKTCSVLPCILSPNGFSSSSCSSSISSCGLKGGALNSSGICRFDRRSEVDCCCCCCEGEEEERAILDNSSCSDVWYEAEKNDMSSSKSVLGERRGWEGKVQLRFYVSQQLSD